MTNPIPLRVGSTAGLTGDSVTASYTYDVFGALRSATQWLFTGEQRDSESGMYYLRARYYDPAIGRFLSRDPIPGGNLYAYAGNDPTHLIEPGRIDRLR